LPNLSGVNWGNPVWTIESIFSTTKTRNRFTVPALLIWTYSHLVFDLFSSESNRYNSRIRLSRIRSLAWRTFATEKVYHTEPAKILKVADNSIEKGFKGYQSSAQDIAAKKEQWAREDTEKKPS
jgi:hypothetical protein